jgi:hypothetical protein
MTMRSLKLIGENSTPTGLGGDRLGDLPKFYSLHRIPELHDLGRFHRELLPLRF